MFRVSTPDDVTEYELEHYINPHFDSVNNYLENYVIPDVCAFFIYSAYKNQLEEESYYIFINDALNNFNQTYSTSEVNSLKKDVSKVLRIKYGLIVTNDDPLRLEESFVERNWKWKKLLI